MKDKDKRPKAGAKCKMICTVPNVTYDHAKKAVMKHTCDNFKLAYTELHYNAERM